MEPCAPDELSRWLVGKLSESPVSEFIPLANLSLIMDQVVSAWYQDGILRTSDLLNLLESEFQVPRETLTPVLSGLKKEAAKLGVTVLLPWETHIQPSTPVGQPSPSAPPAAAPRPAEKSPARKEGLELAQRMADGNYLARVVINYLIRQQHADDEMVARMLVMHYQLSKEEIELLSSVDMDHPDDSLGTWVLRLNAINLGLHLADLLIEDMPDRQPEWSRGVRQLQTRVSEMTTALLARQQQARAESDPGLPILAEAWNRVRKNTDLVDRRLKVLAGKEVTPARVAPAPGPAPRPSPSASAAGSSMDVKKLLIIGGAGVVILATIIFTLRVSGFMSGGGREEVKFDSTGLALPILQSYREGTALVAMVDGGAWLGLSEQGRTDFLLSLYDRAIQAGANQVQLRAGENNILAQAWARDNFKIFDKK